VPVPPRLDKAQDTGTNTCRLAPDSLRDALLQLLAHPNIASKHWIIRQYDHEVQGGSVIKPLVGPRGDGPSDASVILPVAGSTRGLAIACGLATGLCDDPYAMTLAAIDECVRNLVSVGADPRKTAILDNFSWPGVNDPGQLAGLVRAAEACYDGAIAFRTPFVSGKDSLNNQFTTEDGTTIRIPPTLLITGIGIVPDVTKSVTMDAKAAGNLLVLVGGDEMSDSRMGGSHYEMLFGDPAAPAPRPVVNLASAPQTALALHELIQQGLVRSAHDISDGGMLIAAAEMAMAGGLGLELDLGAASSMAAACFSEAPSRYLIEIETRHLRQVQATLGGTTHRVLGAFNATGRLTMKERELDVSIDDIRAAWRGTLDW
jgi:phosphoribosylformylglycinamidine synthase